MLINNWYVLGLSEQIKDEPVGVHALGQDFVLFRDNEGKAHCLSDTCVHRGGSLCRGKVIGGAVECPYHGWRYSGDGACVEIPSLGPDAKIPRRARVDSYPTEDRYGWIWAFLGDLPEEERPPLPEFFPEHDMEQGEWKFVRGEMEFDCNWVRAIENGVDRTHAIWVHTDFGNPEHRIPKPFHVEDDGVSLYCRGKSKPVNKRGVWRDEIPDDRDERENAVRIFIPAPSIRIEMYMQPPKSMFIVTGYTPIDEHRTRLIFTHARNFLTDDKYDADTLNRMFTVLNEDKIILDRLKPQRVPPLLSDELLLDSDRHGVMFRQKVKEREAQGDAIDQSAMQGEDEYARVIPSPARRADPKNWVLRPVIMRKPADKPVDKHDA